MSIAALTDLLRRVKVLEKRPRSCQGVVTATSPLSVEISAAGIPYTDCKRLDSYSPTVGDTVRVEVSSGPPLILGKIV